MKRPKEITLTVGDVRNSNGYWTDDCPLVQSLKRQISKYGKYSMGMNSIRSRGKLIGQIEPEYHERDYEHDIKISKNNRKKDTTILRTFNVTYGKERRFTHEA
jgi:hypothetical protein